MDTGLSLDLLRQFGTALLIGVLVGLDREKRKAEEESAIGGIRTFMLLALLGATSAHATRLLNAPGIFLATMILVGLAVVAAYVGESLRPTAKGLGLTTEMAALGVVLFGGLCVFGQTELAVALGVATSAVLAFKQPIHAGVRQVGTEDLYAALKLLIATFIILPLLPRRPVDPWGALNPYTLWLLVILISGLSFVGYVATRGWGTARGLLLTGVTGGLVSSTAVTLALARRSRDAQGEPLGPLAAGILIGWGVMLPRLAVLLAVASPELALRLWPALLALAAATAATAWFWHTRPGPDKQGTAGHGPLALRNPFSLLEAMKFAALFAVVLVLVKLATLYAGARELYLVAALAGLPDVDAVSLSLAELVRAGAAADLAAQAVVVAIMSNTLLKTALVWTAGSRALRRAILPAAGCLLVVAGAAWALL